MNQRNRTRAMRAIVLGVLLFALLAAIMPVVGRTALAQEAPSVEVLRALPHAWDANPVAYLPESTMNTHLTQVWAVPSVDILRALPHRWDENPVAYLPESTMNTHLTQARAVPSVETLRALPHNWDENSVAYLPESTMAEEPSVAMSE